MSSQQLLLMQNKIKDVIVSNINIEDKSMSDWKIYATKILSKDVNDIDLETLKYYKKCFDFDQIIFYFDVQDDTHWDIWCLDLDHNDKWYKSQYSLPVRWGHMFVDINNDVHLMRCRSRICHWKASLFDLIPVEIMQLNRQKYDLLIIGFVKEFERKNEMTFIPMYLQKLIIVFYLIFV